MIDETETEKDRLEHAIYTALENYAAYLDRRGLVWCERLGGCKGGCPSCGLIIQRIIAVHDVAEDGGWFEIRLQAPDISKVEPVE